MNEDLSLATNEELLDEIFSRFDAAAFSGLKILGDDMPYIIERRRKGNALTCVGLAQQLSASILADHENDAEPADGDEAD